MTDGSSQGLFVVVAVVIFGIFVAISYSLFRDTLTPSLASIFYDSFDIESTKVFITPSFRLIPHASSYTTSPEGIYSIKSTLVNSTNWGDRLPVGLAMSQGFSIPYGKVVTVLFDVFCTDDCVVAIDNNAYSKGDPFYQNPYDSYGDIIKSDNEKSLKGGSWQTFTYSYVNNHPQNTNKETILDNTFFGVQYGQAKNFTDEQKILIKNVRYNVSEYFK